MAGTRQNPNPAPAAVPTAAATAAAAAVVAANVNPYLLVTAPYTIETGMKACGCGANSSKIAENCFGKRFSKMLSDEDVKDALDTLAARKPVASQIHLNPMVKRNVRAFNAWMKHLYRLGQDPKMLQFDPDNAHIPLLEQEAETIHLYGPIHTPVEFRRFQTGRYGIQGVL